MAKTHRPPIITVLGHVDHGKTSLLDAIRSTNVQSGETGGITQHISAYQVKLQQQLVTFIDTPGHQAFTNLRARGGHLADIAILVVAADSGVQPQTIESISHIQKADLPFIVAINKTDLPDIDIQKIKTQLAEHQVMVEGFGGDTPIVQISALKKQNLDQLIETLLVLSELQELKADPQAVLEAVVIEARLDKHRGPLATLIVKNGTLKQGQKISALIDSQPQNNISGKVKSLKDWQGQKITSAPPSTPIQVLGFNHPPAAGSIVTAQSSVASFQDLIEAKPGITTSVPKEDHLNIILKADVLGSLEALSSSLPSSVQLISADTGNISESDILQAKNSQAHILGFRVNLDKSTQKLAQIEEIPVHTFDSIYHLLKKVKQLIKARQKPSKKQIIRGKAKILKIFDFGDYKVFGGKVIAGTIKLQDKVKLKNSPQTATISSLKQADQNVKSVDKGNQFGLIIKPELDIKPQNDIVFIQQNKDND